MEIIAFDRDGDVTEQFRAVGFKTFTGDVQDVVADAVVSPANSFGFMDGGIDWALTQWLGAHVEQAVIADVQKLPFGELLVGQALAVETGNEAVPYLISAPTMRVPKIIQDPADIMLAARAAASLAKKMGLNSIALPGMGTGCRRLRPDIAARAMMAGIQQALKPLPRPVSWREAQGQHFNLTGAV